MFLVQTSIERFRAEVTIASWRLGGAAGILGAAAAIGAKSNYAELFVLARWR